MITSALAFLGVIAFTPAQVGGLEWTRVTTDKMLTISGITHWDGDRFLVVHDSKGDKDTKISFMSRASGSWQMSKVDVTDPKNLAAEDGKSIIKDLESVCQVPDRPGEIMAIGNRNKEDGWVYEFKISGTKAELVDTFKVPEGLADSDYESFDLMKSGSKLVAVWADRGVAGGRAASLWTSNFELGKRPASPFSGVTGTTLSTPYPSGPNSRSISDLRVSRAGDVFVTSATDPGDAGPFDSAAYIVGTLNSAAPQPAFTKLTIPIPVSYAFGYKIEALDFDVTGKKLVFATDDEDGGASIAWGQR